MNKRSFSVVIIFIAVIATMLSCGEAKHKELRASRADSLIFSAGAVKNYARMKELTDSLEMVGDLSPLDANRWRGVYYYRQGHYRMAEVCYRKALDCEVKTSQDQLSYNKSARRLSELLLIKGDFEGSLRVAMPAVKKMEQSGIGSDIDYAILLNNIGCCQLNLGQVSEANESFLIAREHYANRWQSDSTGRGFQEAVIGTVYTSMAYINTRRYADAIYWIDRTEMLLGKYSQKPDARTEYFDEYKGRIEIMRAVALQSLNKPHDAAEAYRKFLLTDYSQTAEGRINANDYLMVAHRYREAANNYHWLDEMLAKTGKEQSLDNIQLYMLPKYKANAEIRQRDSAIVAGMHILAILDSAITTQKNSRTAELATIYDTQGKEAEIARHQAELSQQRLISTGVALVLLIIFFLTYTLHKRKAAHRLAAAHTQLQVAYDQLETTTKAKERIESELRIARDIQMSMVPNIFPDEKNIDVYAAMTPAKEVGGDLYGYLLLDDEFYFCVGDVSGKGVPASLFMAQATRLFRTFATQHMKPADIATYMNAALTENNEQGMFVTMFIGLINLNSGHMDFCNAGHNPPIWGVPAAYLEMETNAPIGLWPDLDFVGEAMDNIKGCPLLIYTDGLNEAENIQQEQFGDDHLLDILNNNHFTSSRQVIETLVKEVEQHRNGAEPNDDLTIMCLLVKGE
ncbi:Serine phosphatase RsbU, regulator of sigma subunit [Prevotella sp. tc2-28]|uniref:SpoIIE family protein phosphatase n=1 Tax=Prevotella sp. tc2-28 TaxID=1761888 RepID=UPI000894C5B5|nr:SpoIIE family protein phosphatase [Prevotella sp. tc2-28]SEA44410.1 Serine phosphatase RsbU, regulator of sigma subunit [Prevotella sp. tc2-28]